MDQKFPCHIKVAAETWRLALGRVLESTALDQVRLSLMHKGQDAVEHRES